MARRDDPIITFLRRCDFDEKVTRFENFGGALYAGSATAIRAVVKNVTSLKKSDISNDITSPADLVPDAFHVDSKPKGIAYYSRRALLEKYKDLSPPQL